LLRDPEELASKLGDQPVRRLEMPLSRRGGIGPELAAPERA
jgi:hypothetical protein